MARNIAEETWEQTGNNAVHLRRSKHFAECVAVTEGDDRKQLAVAIATLPELLRSLAWYVANDPQFGHLDKGIGTNTEAGKARLAAREALAKAAGKPKADYYIARAKVRPETKEQKLAYRSVRERNSILLNREFATRELCEAAIAESPDAELFVPAEACRL